MCEEALQNGKALEVHHKVPKAYGGTNEYSNLQLVHISCHIQHHQKHPIFRKRTYIHKKVNKHITLTLQERIQLIEWRVIDKERLAVWKRISPVLRGERVREDSDLPDLRNTQEIVKRSLYYWSKLYTSQLEQGMPYRSLRKTIAINLLDFDLFPQYDDMHTVGQFWSQQHKEVLLEDLEIHFIEIPKLLQQWREEKINPWENEFARWLLLLPAHEDEHLTHTLEDIAMKQDPMLQKAIQKWENMSQSSSFRLTYEAREKVLFDEKANLAHAREIGIEEGKILLFRSMHKNGMDIEDIVKFTNMELSEIRHILDK